MKILLYEWEASVSTVKLIHSMEQRGWEVKKFQRKIKDYFKD